MNLFKINVKENERGFLFKNGAYIKYLKAGEYNKFLYSKYDLVLVDVKEDFNIEGYDITDFRNDPDLLEELSILDINDKEVCFHYIDNRFENILDSGTYGFWNIKRTHEFKIFDTSVPEISPEVDKSVLLQHGLLTHFHYFDVELYEKALVFYDNTFEKILGPGRYYFWNSPTIINFEKVDTRIREMQISGQEMLTEDKVPVRVNFTCQYKILDVKIPVLEIKDYKSQLYIQMQMLIREYIGSEKFDNILKNKEDMSAFILNKLKGIEDKYGAEFIYAGLKDIILPGEIRDIMNTVLIAEKKAHANIITRREETASTRSLLNTAKLMDDNKTLFRLKELEYIEKICDKIGHISLASNQGLLAQLNELTRSSS